MIIFFFNDTATTEIYTLSLHDALPISTSDCRWELKEGRYSIITVAALLNFPKTPKGVTVSCFEVDNLQVERSEEHTSELQSRQYLVCRLLLEKKKKNLVYKLS